MRARERPRGTASRFVTAGVNERGGPREEAARDGVLELLASEGPTRLTDIASHMGGDESSTHAIIRTLRDEGRVHADSGYWVLGPSKERRW